MTFCKYELPEEKWGELKELVTSSYVELGYINNNPLFAVDVMWNEAPPKEFTSYEVFPNPVGVHTFLGCENLYKNRFCKFQPENKICLRLTPQENS